MNKIRQIVAIAFIALTNILNAQESFKNLTDRINEVTYIFEGKVIKKYPYGTTDDKSVLTGNVIEITKVFKGNLQCGTIELITDGGEIPLKREIVSHALRLEEDEVGLYMCKITDKEISAFDYFNETNLEKLEPTFEMQSFIKYSQEGIDIKAIDAWQKFDDLQLLYDYTTLITQVNYLDCNNANIVLGTTHNSTEKQITLDQSNLGNQQYTKAEYDALINNAEFQRTNFTRPKSASRANNTITYTLSTPIISGTGATGTRYLEFDVLVHDNIGTKYLDQSAVRIKYPNGAFGSNIVASNKITVTRGTINSDPNCYSAPIPTDRTSNVIFIPALEKVYSQCKTQITTTPQSIMHIKMQISNCNVPNINIQIEDTVTPFIGGTLMGNYSAFAEFPNDTFQTYYDDAIANSVKPVPPCKAKILSFSPDTVAGGVGDVLTIRGFQFGTTQGTGNLTFKEAVMGGTLPDIGLEPMDILSWSDTIIKIIVPNIDTGEAQAIGSGKFKIINSLNQVDSSPKPLVILYSLYNQRHKNNNSKVNVYHTGNNVTGGYSFYVDTSISHNPAAYGCVKKAIKEWQCATGINFTIKGDTFGIGKDDQDFINIIKFGYISDANAKCYTTFADCNISFSVIAADIDLIINNGAAFNWWYDSSGTQTLPQYRNDFYKSVLHELGHGVHHSHVNDKNAVMYFSEPFPGPGGVPGYLRKIDLKHDVSAITGGRYQVLISTNPNNFIGCGINQHTALPTCAGYTYIEDYGSIDEMIKAFPNPFTNQISISTEANIKSIQLFDIKGATLISTFPTYQTNNTEIDLSNNLVAGLYLLKIETEKGTTYKKLIRE